MNIKKENNIYTPVRSIIPLLDSTVDLGSSSKHFANLYTDKIFLNSTATLDGSVAGVTTITGGFSANNNSAIGDAATIAPDYALVVNTYKLENSTSVSFGISNYGMDTYSARGMSLQALASATAIILNLTSTLVTGATSATLSTAWLRNTSTSVLAVFSNGDVKTITLTQGSTAISWTGGLTSNTDATVRVSKDCLQGVTAIEGYSIVGGTNWGNSVTYTESSALFYGLYSGTTARSGSKYRKMSGIKTYADWGFSGTNESYSAIGLSCMSLFNGLNNRYLIRGYTCGLKIQDDDWVVGGNNFHIGNPRQAGLYLEKPTFGVNSYQQLLSGSGSGTGLFFNGETTLDVNQGSVSRIYHDGTNLRVCGNIVFGSCTKSAVTYVGMTAANIETSNSQMYTGTITTNYAIEVQTVSSKPIQSITSKEDTFEINIFCTGHGFLLNDYVELSGMSNSRYNGWYKVSGVISVDQFRVQQYFYGTATGNAIKATFRWSDDGGSTWDASDLQTSGGNRTLNNGIKINFKTNVGLSVGNTAAWNYSLTDYHKILSTGSYTPSDTLKYFYGAGSDMTIWYDGTYGQIKTSDVAASDLRITTGAEKTLELQNVVYDDFNIAVSTGKVPAANYPAWTAFVGNHSQYTFAVDDYIQLESTEFLHTWKEGTALEIHVHWATGGLNDATVRGVKWEAEYTWANTQTAGGTIVFASTSGSAETSIAANEAALTHKYTSILTFTPTGGKIGGQILIRLKRIASVTNTAPANNPFCLSVGIHHQIDTMGSRTISAK